MTAPPSTELRRTRADSLTAGIVFVLLLAVYHANIYLSFAADATSNVYLALSLLNDGDMVFTPSESPLLFEWSVVNNGKSQKVDLTAIDESMEKLRQAGQLVVKRPRYLIVPSIREGQFVSTFNPGASLVALPFFAALQIFLGDLREEPAAMWFGAKFVSAVCVAGSAVFVFLSVRLFQSRVAAVVIALSYGLGTSVWTTSSQGLWQHGPTELFLAAGCYFLLRDARVHGVLPPALVGFLLGLATLCRPTMGIVVVAVGIYYLARSRDEVMGYILGGLPLAILLGAYNTYYLGSPLRFGETLVLDHAIEKTGGVTMFPTPVWIGAGVGLISPSRGLLFFSPFLIFGIWGAIAAWRKSDFVALRPLTIAVLGIWLVHSMYFDYWGGWTYGNRTLIDTTPLLSLFLVPVWGSIASSLMLRTLFGATVALSVSVQLLGAFAYDLAGWNARTAYEITSPQSEIVFRTFDPLEAETRTKLASGIGVTRREIALDIDKPENRYRFWSLTDSQIPYYAKNFQESCRRREYLSTMFTKPLPRQLAENHGRIGQMLLEVGDPAAAAQAFAEAMRLDPTNADYSSKFREAEDRKLKQGAESK